MSFELILPFLRPIESLLLDESVSKIMGNPDASRWYERDGIMLQEKTILFDAGKLQTGLDVIANQLGKKLDEDNPLLRAQLRNRSRLAAVIPPVVRIRHICASVRLDEETAAQVDQCAAFIGASADDVVDQALNYLCLLQRPCLPEFLKTPQAKLVPSTLRIRKAARNGAPLRHGKKLGAGVESTSSVRAVKA